MSNTSRFAWLVAAWLLGCGSPLVGAECREGFSLCGSECVDTSNDYRHCGGCGNDCGLFVCDEGTCSRSELRPDAGSARLDGGTLDGATADAGASDGGSTTVPSDGGFDIDAGLPGCRIGLRECGAICVDPGSDPAHCGACDNACDPSEVCSGGTCAMMCEAPLTLCSGRCFDLENDPRHCGTCTTSCASGICESGSCADRIAGHAVVIGHDLSSANIVMRRLSGNAVFLGRGAPVRVLTYEGEATAGSIAGVEAAINLVKSEIGRDWQKIDAIEAIVPLQLASADVFVVHAQAGATKSTLAKLGQQWGNALAQFVATGGVIVLFEGPSTKNDGTYRVLEPAAIFSAAERATITNQQLRVATPGIGIAVRAPDRYMSAPSTVRFSGITTPGTTVVVDGSMAPVIVHRVIVP